MSSSNDLGVGVGSTLDINGATAGWSSEYTVVECRELQATAMCVDAGGSRALLAGRRVTAIVALDQLEVTSTGDSRINNTRASQASAVAAASTAVSVHQRSGKYDVTAAEWCPLDVTHAALAINQRVELLDIGMTGVPRTHHQLNAHARVVTDLHWHRTDPNVLATCSADTFTHVWDVREPRRPALSLAAVAEASQVRWNAIRESVLATAHDGDVKVWDRRQTTQPIHYIAAHVAKIHGVQWSPHDEHELATCSQDGTVKLWHIQQPRRPQHCLATSQPVWRVRYTPFGRGLITVVLPAQLRRTQHDHSLLLWNMHSRTQPQHAFVGHEDVVLEFDWRRSLAVGNDDHQLVTWAKDGTLRVWRVDPYLQKLCGHVPHSSVVSAEESARNSISGLSTVNLSSPPVHTLQQEFSLLNLNIQGVDILEMDPIARTCAVSVATLVGTQEIGKKIIVRAFFPSQYPLGMAPEFNVTPDTPNGDLLKALQAAARDRVARSRTCLEPCLRRLVHTLDQLSEQQEQRDHGEEVIVVSATETQTPVTNLSPPFGSYDDACIPFPRTCGARFCSVDMLVCFVRTPSTYRRSVQTNSSSKDTLVAPTPRSLSALSSINGDVSISSFYYQERKHRTKSSTTTGSSRHRLVASTAFRPTVTIYCASGLFPLNRWLGERYRLDGSAIVACRHNASAAATAGRADLVHVWRTAELAARFQAAMTASILANGSDNCDDGAPWTHHPFGKRLVHSLVAHYAERGDLQTAAVLSCIFSRNNGSTVSNLSAELQSRAVTVSKGNVYHTVGGSSSQPPDIAYTAESWSQAQIKPQNQQQRRRSLDRLPTIESATSVTDNYRWRDIRSTSLNQQETLHQSYKLAYAEVLHRWGLLYARADLLKHAPLAKIANIDQQHRGVEFVTECAECGESARDAHCTRCKRYAFSCAICRVSVRGSANFCLVCGHGGHAQHLQDWFGAGNQMCPTGCGCTCLRETASLISAH